MGTSFYGSYGLPSNYTSNPMYMYYMSMLMQQQQQMQTQLQAQQQAQIQAQQQAEMQAQLKQAMKQILTPEARGRLDNLRLTKPELVQNIEIQLLQSAQAGSLRGKVTDEQLKVLLKNLMGQKREIHITRR